MVCMLLSGCAHHLCLSSASFTAPFRRSITRVRPSLFPMSVITKFWDGLRSSYTKLVVGELNNYGT